MLYYKVYLCVCRVLGLHKPQAPAHHVLYSTVGIVLSQTGDWFGGRSNRKKENNDSSAQVTVTELLKLAVTVRLVPLWRACGYSAVEIGNNSNLFD